MINEYPSMISSDLDNFSARGRKRTEFGATDAEQRAWCRHLAVKLLGNPHSYRTSWESEALEE
jgi:hypothetical protein